MELDLSNEIDALENLKTGTEWRNELAELRRIMSDVRFKLDSFDLFLHEKTKSTHDGDTSHENLLSLLKQRALTLSNNCTTWSANFQNHVKNLNDVIWSRYGAKRFEDIPNANQLVDSEIEFTKQFIYDELAHTQSMVAIEARKIMHDWRINRKHLVESVSNSIHA